MDPPITKPRNKQEPEIFDTLANAFEDELIRQRFPLDIAENITKYAVDENLSLKPTAENVIKDHHSCLSKKDRIKNAEQEIMKKHAKNYLLPKEVIRQNEYLKELSKIKPIDVFKNLELSNILEFGLIQKEDLQGDLIEKYLEYRAKIQPEVKSKQKPILKSKRVISEIKSSAKNLRDKNINAQVPSFEIDPKEVYFKNFDKGETYKIAIKFTNLTASLQSISVYKFPREKCFKLDFVGSKVASGMSLSAKLFFKPEMHFAINDEIICRSGKGELITIPIKCIRDPPKIFAYVYRAQPDLSLSLPRNFSEKNAIPNAKAQEPKVIIDCGSCFATQYNLVHLIMKNTGNAGQFLLVTEEDWFRKEINNIPLDHAITSEFLWLYPTCIDINRDEMAGIYIIFHPLDCGRFAQTSYMICDNNCCQQFEIIGNGLCFGKDLVSVDLLPYKKDIQNLENYCIFLGNTYNDKLPPITLTIRNRSAILLKCFIHIEKGNLTSKNTINSDKKWLIPRENEILLEPYTAKEAVCDVVIKRCPEGYLCLNLSLIVTDIPIASLKENEEFSVFINNNNIENVVENLLVADIQILKVEVACFVKHPSAKVKMIKKLNQICEKCQAKHCNCYYCKEPETPLSDLMFCDLVLDLGLIPLGISVEKKFSFGNVGENELHWKIGEFKYNVDKNPRVEILENTGVHIDHGKIGPNCVKNLSYKVDARNSEAPLKCLHILVIFSVREDDLRAEHFCLVTYELFKYNFAIETETSDEAIICPMEMLYTKIPIEVSFKITNLSRVTGAFSLMNPIGEDASKVDIKFDPPSELKPQESQTINLTLECHDVGIIENVFIPCFIGLGQDPIMITLLCVVDCLHVFIYLPEIYSQHKYKKVFWPPKVVYELDNDWSQYCLCEDEFEEEFDQITLFSKTAESEKGVVSLESHSPGTLNSFGFDTIKQDENFLERLEKVDSELILRDNVVQMLNVPVNTPTKIKMFIENVTPKPAHYKLTSSNFPAKANKSISKILNIKYEKTDYLWDSIISTKSILVEPEEPKGTLGPFDLKTLNIWVYANTWGIYTEEIIIDMNDIISFSFSIIIEVVGCPLLTPLGGDLYPVLRLGSIHDEAEEIKRKILITNTSSINLTVTWNTYLLDEETKNQKKVPPFNLMLEFLEEEAQKSPFLLEFSDVYLGKQAGLDYFQISESQTVLKAKSTTYLEVMLIPRKFKCQKAKQPLTFYILGKICVEKSDSIKSNYYYRPPQSLTIQITTTIECPQVQIEIEEEDQNLHIYANEILLRHKTEHLISFTMLNKLSSLVTAFLDVKKPYFFVDDKSRCVMLKPATFKKISLAVRFSHQELLEQSEEVYQKKGTSTEWQTSFIIDKTERTVSVKRIVRITFTKQELSPETCKCSGPSASASEGCFQKVPLQICLFYPSLTVKPMFVKFGYATIGCTHKTYISVINMTGYEVMFEVYKSCSTQEILVSPHFGRIEKSVGVNYSFANIKIYFTPMEPRNYQESIRITTNIPNYYFDIPIKGSCKFNEKFECSRLDIA